MLGYREAELIGRDWFEAVVPEASREIRRQIFDAAVASGTAYPGMRENSFITRSGEELILAWQDVVLTDDDARPIGIIASGSDVTDRIKAEVCLLYTSRCV